MGGSYMFWNGEKLPNNADLVYPLHLVSTLECRTQLFSSLSDKCKITLPIINQADYSAYQRNSQYTDIYTTLWGANYQHSRDQQVGAHYWVDIATARGTPLYALADGEVYAAEFNSAYGNVVKLKFKYKGEIFYAIYAHMDNFSVKKGDQVTKGQKIGEVGNTGNTFGALWGYHVHFEIDKDAGGRPAYAYMGCPDLDKGHSVIIAEGLCRIQMIQYTKDPILFLENADARLPLQLADPTPTDELTGSNVPSVQQPEQHSESQPTTWSSQVQTWSSQVVDSQDTSGALNELLLDFSRVDLIASQFLNKRDVRIEKDFWMDLPVGQPATLTLSITDKKTGAPFNGTLPQPLLLVANTTNLQITPVSTVVVTQGSAKIHLMSKISGNAYVFINLWTNKIGDFYVNIK